MTGIRQVLDFGSTCLGLSFREIKFQAEVLIVQQSAGISLYRRGEWRKVNDIPVRQEHPRAKGIVRYQTRFSRSA